MNPKQLHNLTLIPVFLLGLISFVMGFGWLLSPEPWLLDQSANEALLGVTFSQLFSEPVNQNLSAYLTLSYRFFGWWIICIGMLVIAFTVVTRLGTPMARGFIHFILLVLLIGLTIIEKSFIPSSPFLLLTMGFWLLWFISFWAGIKLKKYHA